MLPHMTTPRQMLVLLSVLAAASCQTPSGGGPKPITPPTTQPATLPATVASGLEAEPELELVESVPLETNWDQPDVRNTQQVWLEMIGRARQTLDVAQFYFAHQQGKAMGPVLAALEQAAARGVKVRVLAEKKFLRISKETLARLSKQKNIEVTIFDLSRSTGGILHAKYFIVDRREIFVGSQNFDWRALEHIHEIGVRVRGRELALTLWRIFEADWQKMKHRRDTYGARIKDSDGDGLPDHLDPRPGVPTWTPRPGKEPELLYLVASPPALEPRGIIYSAGRLVKLLDGAQKSVVIQLLNYSVKTYGGGQWLLIDDALRRAARRGVKVRLNLSHWTKKRSYISSAQELAREPNIQIKLNTIPAHSGGYIPFARVDHSKYMVIDGRTAWVGTSNWSGDYFTASRNVEVVFRHKTEVGKLARIFEHGWSGPYVELLDPDKKYQPPKTR